MDFLLEIADTTGSPFTMVILLALVFSLDPCLMLTNIAAIGYVNQGATNKKRAFVKGLWYVFGRIAAYGCLGFVIIILLKIGGNIQAVQDFFGEWGEIILIPFMILMGILICVADYIPVMKIGVKNVNLNDKSHKGRLGAFILGAVLSLAFCPTNAVIFFGIIVPIASSSVSGYLLASVFAVITAIPIVIIAWILAFSFESIGRYYDKIKVFGKRFKWIVGLLFIAIGIYLAIGYSN